MAAILQLFISFISTLVLLSKSGSVRSLVRENLALRQQLIVANRGRKRSPPLLTSDRIILALLTPGIAAKRLMKIAIILKPATLLRFHKYLVKLKYKKLFSSHSKPGPKGPRRDLINLVLEIKERNSHKGYDQIAEMVYQTFGILVDKHVVRRILEKHYLSTHPSSGPSWLTFLAHQKDSLWSVDFFRCESINLRSYWVMVVMDVFTRRIVGFAVQPDRLCGASICRMFNKTISGKSLPKYLSSDNDPLFKYHRWIANLDILEIQSIKSVPYTPRSHPFIERLIGTVRREYLDHTLFWNERDLLRKLNQFKDYYNNSRGHLSLDAKTPVQKANDQSTMPRPIENYFWKSHCNGLFQIPIPV